MENDFSQVTQTKLTNWANEPKLEDLKQNLSDAKPSHDEWVSKIKRWNDLLDVKGSAVPPKIKGKSSVQPRLVRRQAEWRYSAMTEPFLSSDKIFQVNPRTFEDIESARQNELLLNWQFNTVINRVKFIDELVRTVVDEGTAVIRVGWDKQTEIVKEPEEQYNYYPAQDPMYIEQLSSLVQLKQHNPREYFETVDKGMQGAVDLFMQSQQPCVPEFAGTIEVEKEKVKVNQPFFSILNPENVYIDPSCEGDLDKASFVITSFETSLAELASSGLYTNLDKINFDNSNLTDADHSYNTDTSFNFKDKARKRVVAYEYWGKYDIHNNNTLVPFVATWIGNVLIRMEENPFPDEKLPFIVIPYLPVKRSIYGEPDAVLLEDNQRIIGAVTRGMIDLLASSANSQQGFAKGFLDIVNKRKFEKGDNYEFNPSMPVGGSYIQHTFPEVPSSAYNLIAYMNQDAESLTGVKAFSGGISGEAYGMVATGIRGALDASNKREMAILRRLAQGMKELATKIIAMNYVFLSEQEIVRVTNKEFVTIRREDLKGNFDLMIDISTSEIDNIKAQDLGFMLQTIGPNLDTGIMLNILSKIADLKRMPDLAEDLRNYTPQPNPMDELMLQKTKSEIDVNNAKVADLQSQASHTNLQTQQEADGTTHQRQLERQRAQARANQDLAITQAAVKPTKYNELPPNLEKGIGYRSISKYMD